MGERKCVRYAAAPFTFLFSSFLGTQAFGSEDTVQVVVCFTLSLSLVAFTGTASAAPARASAQQLSAGHAPSFHVTPAEVYEDSSGCVSFTAIGKSFTSNAFVYILFGGYFINAAGTDAKGNFSQPEYVCGLATPGFNTVEAYDLFSNRIVSTFLFVLVHKS